MEKPSEKLSEQKEEQLMTDVVHAQCPFIHGKCSKCECQLWSSSYAMCSIRLLALAQATVGLHRVVRGFR